MKPHISIGALDINLASLVGDIPEVPADTPVAHLVQGAHYLLGYGNDPGPLEVERERDRIDPDDLIDDDGHPVPDDHYRRADLVRAGALIAAAIDQCDHFTAVIEQCEADEAAALRQAREATS